MMQRIAIRQAFQNAEPGDDITVELKPAETIINVGPYDGDDLGYPVWIAGPREDV